MDWRCALYGQQAVGGEGGADLAAVVLGGMQQRWGRDAVAEAQQGTSGPQRWELVVVRVQDAESNDLLLELDAGLHVMGKSGAI